MMMNKILCKYYNNLQQSILISMMKKYPLIKQISSQDFESTNTQQQEQQLSNKKRYDPYAVRPLLRGRTSACIVCKKQCHYSCSKCSKNYCGVEHFRSHNLFCSQQFYQKQVNEALKGMKIKDPKQKKKAAQMVKKYQQQLQNEQIQSQLTVQRLQQILKMIEQQKQPQLTKKQQYFFHQYLQTLNIDINQLQNQNSDKLHDIGQLQTQLPQIQKQYWEIEQGLAIYVNQEMQIQQYNETQYPELVSQRFVYAKQMRQYVQLHMDNHNAIYNFPKILDKHVTQLIYLYVLMNRVYDAQLSDQFKQILISSYTSIENERLLRINNIDIQQLIQQIQVVVVRTYNSINGVNNNVNTQINNNNRVNNQYNKSVIKLWVEDQNYVDIIINDINKIVNNKYLIIETLLRIIQFIKSNQASTQINKVNDILYQRQANESNKNNRQSRKYIKIIKKCEYLLKYIWQEYNQQEMNKNMQNIKKIKTKQTGKTFQQTNILNIVNK